MMIARKKNAKDQIMRTPQSIDEDLIVEILSRLPPLDVLRFKRVSKRWYSLISHSHFFLRHFHLHRISRTTTTDTDTDEQFDCLILRPELYFPKQLPFCRSVFTVPQEQDPCLGLSEFYFPDLQPTKRSVTTFPQNDSGEPSLLELIDLGVCHLRKNEGLPFDDEDTIIVDSCNGLLLIRSTHVDDLRIAYYVCNPITKQYIKLPDMKEEPTDEHRNKEHGGNRIFGYSPQLVFDPSVSPVYKVVKCLRHVDTSVVPVYEENAQRGYHEDLHDIYVYSSDTCSWRLSVSNTFDSHFDFKGVYLNGLLYLPTHGESLLCYDVKEEVSWFLPLPPKLDEDDLRSCIYFGKCDGYLRWIEDQGDGYQTYSRFPYRFDVMEAKPHENHSWEWTVKYRVKIGVAFGHYFLDKHPPLMFVMHHYKTGDKGGEALLLNIGGTFVPFNLTTNTFMPTATTRQHLLMFKYGYPYTISLFPLS